MSPVLSHQLGKLVLETLALTVGVAAAVWLGRRLFRSAAAPTAAVVIGAFALVCGLGHAGADRTALGDDRRIPVSARAGTDYCFLEEGAGDRIGFINWVRARMPPHAVYELDVPPSAEPDGWCLTLALLPALPAGPGDTNPGWEIAFGQIPAPMQARIARHDPSVVVYRRGFALARR